MYWSCLWLTANGQVSEKEPSRDEGLLGAAGGLVHDVQVRGVEAQSGGGQTVSHQIHPQQLDGDQGLRETQCSGEEDTEEESFISATDTTNLKQPQADERRTDQTTSPTLEEMR